MNFFIYEIFDKIDLLKQSISDFFNNKIFPGIKIGALYIFAKCGIVSAQLAIANVLSEHYWYLKPKNPEQWIKKGVSKNIPFAMVLKGHFCDYKAREIEDEAYEFIENVVDPNYKPDTSFEIGYTRVFEEKEKRIVSLFHEELDLYKKAAEMNYALGQFNFYMKYEYYRCRLNLEPADDKYLKLAAENGLPNAQYILAKNFLAEDDLEKGIYWMNKAANSKKKDWIKNTYYYDERKKAREWCRENNNILETKEKAFLGDSKAMYDYSQYIFHYSYKEKFLQLSHEWQTKAAKAGYPKAMAEEGIYILYGWTSGTLRDAFEYLRKAYENGYKMASWNLGDCYYYGWGTNRSLDKAKYYYRIAKRLGVRCINMRALNKMTEEEFLEVESNRALKELRRFYN